MTEQLVALTAARGAPQHQNPHSRRVNAESGDDVESEDGDNPFAVLRPQRKELAVVPDTFRRWESGFKLDIPEFKEAHQKALTLEKQAGQKSGFQFGNITGSRPIPLVNNQTTIGKPLTDGQANRAPINSNTARCFKCGEPGHRMADCKRNERFGKGLFVDAGDNEIEQPSEEQAAQYDEDGVEEEFVQGDYGPLLVGREENGEKGNGGGVLSFKIGEV
ncbi:hypothetical protein RHSIM_Rhsim10G0085700 [Rhododendron simsii]|uniref:CCHC-type domain-containing protein n=1 Tax=Rhododendron simsii TaxID=118357 RepID=A0A834GEW4_RHOSS|nr:hypothetical protein RHSIM_Rhsim10G0085700 [Rhododendron simsii]